MEVRRLGASGLEVSTLCLGAMTFGEADDKSFMHGVSATEEAAFEIMDAAREAGINFIDTADVYGQDGLSERVVGRWLEERKAREETVLATKFRFRMTPGPNGTGASRRRIVQAVEASLGRLRTDRIDLYQIHMQDLDTPEEETIRALDDLVRAGKVLYLDCSNYAAYRLVESLWTSERVNASRFISLQAQYSLVARELEREHVPLCQRFGLGILPWSPLAAGFLSGKYKRSERAPDGARLGSSKWQSNYARFDTERNWKALTALEAVAGEVGASFSEVALAWLLGKPGVTSVIFGARTLTQLRQNLGAAKLKLSEAQRKALDDASALDLGYPYDFMQRIQGRW